MIGQDVILHFDVCEFNRAFSGHAIALRALCMCYGCLIALFMGIDCVESMGGHDFVSD